MCTLLQMYAFSAAAVSWCCSLKVERTTPFNPSRAPGLENVSNVQCCDSDESIQMAAPVVT